MLANLHFKLRIVMSKIKLDKYYTSESLAKYCVNKTKETIGVKNIREWLEPSAGGGAFLPFLDNNYKLPKLQIKVDYFLKVLLLKS
jgi:hypothetical protein